MRIRSIKPEFFEDERIAALSPWARLLFIGCWSLADRNGVLENRPLWIQIKVFPYENREAVDASQLLHELESGKFIIPYQVEGSKYYWIPRFTKHQRFSGKEAQSEGIYPMPPNALIEQYSMGKQLGSNREVPGKQSRTQEQGTGNREQGKDTLFPVEDEKETKYAETDSVIDYLNEKAGSKYTHSKSSRENIHGRLQDGFSVEDCRDVIDFKVSEWLGTDMEQYLRPVTLFGPKKFEGYVFAAQRWVKAGRPHKRGLKEFEQGEREYPEGEEI